MNVIQFIIQKISHLYSQVGNWFASIFTPAVLTQIAFTIAVFAVLFIFRNALTNGILRFLKFILRHMLPDHLHTFIEACRNPLTYLLPLLGLFFITRILPFPPSIDPLLNQGLKIGLWVLFFWIFANLSNGLFDAIKTQKTGTNRMTLGILHLFKKITFIGILCLGVAVILSSLHYPITSLVTAMGIGGAALAFASKDTIANFFGSLSLVFDHPFKLGDNIKIGNDIDGTVESIGLRSTHIRTIDGSSLSIPNNVLANYNINNWTNLTKRRVFQTLHLTYDTAPSVIKSIIQDIKNLIESNPYMEVFSINFFDFGESSLNIQLIYHVKETDFKRYLHLKEQVNFDIMAIIEKQGATLAFPTRTLHMHDEEIKKSKG